MEITPIAYFRTRKKHSYEAARQGAIDVSDEEGEIQFESKKNFEQALDGIEGFSHLWVMYQFHQNPNWKPKVMPPRGSSEKIGVFATRSPHRPNALGLSCVELVERDGLILRVKNFDLLDGTPIFDIKPYIPYADSIPEAKIGWLQNIEEAKFTVQFSEMAQAQIDFLKQHQVHELTNFLLQQLQFDPLNTKKKRLKILSKTEGTLAYRTWRAQFTVQDQGIQILKIFSGYSTDDLSNAGADTYQDKDIHRAFLERFQS
ncbi:MAG: tRNA (N6-threonylcarbamoyladenosine(37)-N6)-methyltransferase TrmO [Pseudobdellovibrionaceae bacterium]